VNIKQLNTSQQSARETARQTDGQRTGSDGDLVDDSREGLEMSESSQEGPLVKFASSFWNTVRLLFLGKDPQNPGCFPEHLIYYMTRIA